MAVTVTTIIAGPFTPNGVATSFAFAFKVVARDELVVFQGDPDNWIELDSALYSVSISPDVEGGTVNFTTAPVSGTGPLYIVSNPSFQQQGAFTGGEVPFTPKALNALFDRAAVRTLVLKDKAERSLLVPMGESPLPVASLAGSEGKVLGVVAGIIAPIANTTAAVASDVAAAVAARQQTALDSAATADDREAVAEDRAVTEQARADALDVVEQTAAALAVGTVSDLVGDRIYTSRTLLEAETVPADNPYALVVSDPTPANNDLYRGDTAGNDWGDPIGFLAAASSGANAARDEVLAIKGQFVDLYRPHTFGRPSITSVNTSGASNGTYVLQAPFDFDVSAKVLRFRNVSASPVTVYIRPFTVSGLTATPAIGSAWVPYTVPAGPGNVSVNVGETVGAGECPGVSVPAGCLNYLTATPSDGDGYLFTSTGQAGAFTAGSLTSTIQLQFGLDGEYLYVTSDRLSHSESEVADVRGVTATVENSFPKEKVTSFQNLNTSDFDLTTSNFFGWARVIDVGPTLRAGEPQQAAVLRLQPEATSDRFILNVWDRDLSDPNANLKPPIASDRLLASVTITVASTGLAANQFGDVVFPLGGISFPAGHAAAVEWHSVNANNVIVECGTGRGASVYANQRERGWFSTTSANALNNGLGSTASLGFRFVVERFVLAAPGGGVTTGEVDLLTAAYPTLDISGFSLTIGGHIHRDAIDLSLAGVLALGAAASGKERVDLIVADRLTGAISQVAGGVRDANLDAQEWQAAQPAGSILLARALVTNATVSVVNAADFRGMIRVGREGEHAAHVQRNRQMIRRALGKVGRGSAIKLGGYGDSITAFQSTSGAASMAYTANGQTRDRVSLYFGTYPSDSLALIPLFDFGDGAGAVHCKVGWNWAIKSALDELAGTAAVTYNNYGIGSTTSENSQYNGLYPARIAVPLAASLDLVVIAFGMNERGQPYTYANIVNMVGQFKAAGTECVVMGCPRPNASQSVTSWRYTNDALEAAAMDTGAAYVSTAMIGEPRNLGGIGLPAELLGALTEAAGAGNHPGLFELAQYGRASCAQLGL